MITEIKRLSDKINEGGDLEGQFSKLQKENELLRKEVDQLRSEIKIIKDINSKKKPTNLVRKLKFYSFLLGRGNSGITSVNSILSGGSDNSTNTNPNEKLEKYKVIIKNYKEDQKSLLDQVRISLKISVEFT